MIKLDRVTLICVDTLNIGAAIASMRKSMDKVKFAKCVLLTNVALEIDGIDIKVIPTINSKEEYSKFIIKELYKYFDTDYCLIVQHDAWVLWEEAWKDSFYDYDVIGSAWVYTDGRNVGNGGFSLRSKKLQTILGTDTNIKMYSPEDEVIGRLYRQYLEETHGIKYPSDEVADTFAYELREPICKTFGFHSFFHQPFQETIVLSRSGALGDIVAMEPVMRHFAMNGYNVVLDIPLDVFELFKHHYFPVKHISQFDRGRIPHKIYSLDLAYEVKPRQPYLKSYFEFCGIKNFKLSRPQLYPLVNDVTRLFKKYAVIHIDQRNTPHRNVFGVDFKRIKKHLEAYGYLVLQIGKGDHEEIALEINTSSVAYMKFIIAGAALFIGVDSGPASIAIAHNIPSVLFFGSVESTYVHPDLTNVEIIQQPCIYSGCWHQPGSTTGKECVFNPKKPPCCVHDTEQVIDAINKLHDVSRETN